MFNCYFYNFFYGKDFDTLLEAVKYGAKSGFEFVVICDGNVVYQ